MHDSGGVEHRLVWWLYHVSTLWSEAETRPEATCRSSVGRERLGKRKLAKGWLEFIAQFLQLTHS